MNTSERASAGIVQMHRNQSDLDILREEWRILAKEWVAADDRVGRLEEGRKMLLAELKLALIKAGSKIGAAEDEARTSQQFKDYVRKYHDAKRVANDLRIDMKNADLTYWQRNNSEATERAERRMSR